MHNAYKIPVYGPLGNPRRGISPTRPGSEENVLLLPIDVTFLTQDLTFGGDQRQTLELARRLSRSRFSPSIWTLTGPTDLDSAAKDAGIPVRHLGHLPVPELSFPFRLLKELLCNSPEVLVLCMPLANVWGRILGRAARVPVIVGNCRSLAAVGSQREGLLWRAAHHIICNSMPLYNHLCNLGIPSGRLTFMSNAVDVAQFVPGPVPMRQREPLVLSVGRLVSEKDHMTLIRAFGHVLQEHPTAKLRIVGEGPQEFTLRRVIEGKPYRGHVHIVGGGVDMLEQYQMARVFALAATRAGQPSAVMEAMACGLPVVATQVGSIPALVNPNITGQLAPPSNAVTLGVQISQLLSDATACERMGNAGREKVEKEFAYSSAVAHHESLFERLWELHRGKA